MLRFWALFLTLTTLACAAAPHVRLDDQHLYVDGKPAPYLYGAEVQYFRARGGAGRNVPAAQVTALWNKLLDRVKEAKMNTVIFYIPWDFHEPKEGVFDFDGTLDQDNDGKPDYPSRNVKLFLKLVAQHGIEHVMVRPGPYINAEWGPEGFGAIPLWFLNQYPDALAKNRTPGKPRVVSFGHPIFRDRARRWIDSLYTKVLKDWIGPGKRVDFLQIDNETNFFWDSVYERDRNPDAIARYRQFLRGKFNNDIAKLNAAYGAQATSFDTVAPPETHEDHAFTQAAWHYDWYLFHDLQIAEYHRFVRQLWEANGVQEPDVLFTTCDSFNALNRGLLPRLDFRAENGLSLSTMNVYPKTAGSQADSTLNQPMKAAHDAALFGSAHRQVYGNAGDWVMSTETVGGWFPPVEVSIATRQHTYGSLFGAGIKAMVIYYFHEGYNWTGLEGQDSELHFDAPLDKDLNPRPAFGLLKEVGEHLEAELGAKLMEARAVTSPILIAHDNYQQYPIPNGPDAHLVQSDEMAALYGWFREAGYLPEVAFLDRMTDAELGKYKVVVWNDSGYIGPVAEQKLIRFTNNGGTVITFGNYSLVQNDLGQSLHFPKNPAVDWNTDGYLKQRDVSKKLTQLRGILNDAGLPAQVTVKTADGQPFVHAWFRRQPNGNLLLFVENFQRKDRQVTLQLFDQLLPVRPQPYQVVPLWKGTGAARDLVSNTVTLPVAADGVSVWEVR